ncbi:hypothetical protein EVAR_84890_1 [Eumeta japonica]|uniref:Uncharacterized protein n=1 Tax=Eumeta variegata TaxID=151549 RepID=A0A4C1YEJ1_EUMVA|nr:hypothetical protein EVAR_84890_1 [Eumeta japonica]
MLEVYSFVSLYHESYSTDVVFGCRHRRTSLMQMALIYNVFQKLIDQTLSNDAPPPQRKLDQRQERQRRPVWRELYTRVQDSLLTTL